MVSDMAKHLGEEFPAPPREMCMRQGLKLAEEAGEAAGALNRYLGLARRSGTLEEAEDELADVVITAYLMAHYLGSDLDTAIIRKAEKIFSRGWRDGKAAPPSRWQRKVINWKLSALGSP
jgi:NTP pyrophosphatase (non-canonical NTP hydrolase)